MRSKREDSGMAKNIAAWSKRMKELRVENNLSQTDVAKDNKALLCHRAEQIPLRHNKTDCG